jgi:Lrp/AsnC family transcriptional regulator for asnA, asnC and gidA
VAARAAGTKPAGRSGSRLAPGQVTVRDLDDLDRGIIEHLQDNGRRSNAAIARALGVTETTIRNRIERLVAREFIRIVAVIDPRKTAYRVDAIIWMRVDRGRAESIARQLAAFQNVVYVGHTTGRYDLLIEGVFESDEALFEFLTTRLSGSLGILQSETYHVLRTEKINYDWKLPLNDRSAGGSGGDATRGRATGAGTSPPHPRAGSRIRSSLEERPGSSEGPARAGEGRGSAVRRE